MPELSPGTRRFACALAVVQALLLGACDDEQPPAPAFDAKLVLGTRDMGRVLVSFDGTRQKLYLSRPVATFAIWEPGRSYTLSDIYTLDIASGEEKLLIEKVIWFVQLESSTDERVTLFVHQDSLDYGMPATLTVLYEDGSRADYDDVVPSSIGWSDEFLVFIRNTYPRELWAGSFKEPRLVSGELGAHDWQFIGRDQLAFAGAPKSTGLLFTEHPGIFRVDLTSGAMSEEFPAQIDGAEWAGDEPAPDLAADGLEPTTGVEGRTIAPLGGGCWSATQSVAWGAADLSCYLLYVRRMKDGTLRPFVGLPDEHREIALPGEAPSEFATAGPDVHFVPFGGNAPLAIWQVLVSGSSESTLAMWDAANQRFSSCAISKVLQNFAWRPDGRAFAYGDGEKLTLVESGVEGCFEFAAPQTDDVVFSPEGSRLIWPADRELWSARGDGRGAERRLTGAELSRFRFIDEDRLLALRNSSDGEGLISLDLSEPTPAEHPIVEQVFATGPRIGPHFLGAGSRYNAQDRTGTFGLIDLEASAPVDIADSVADYAIGFPAAPGADSFPFAYLRIGRFASERDGIWIGRIPNALVE